MLHLARVCVYNNLRSHSKLSHFSILPGFERNFSSEIPKSQSMKNVTAGILIIGDEILKGQVVDTNTQYLTKKLYELGVKVEKISVLPDHVDVISNEVQLFSKNFTYVLTSGGIGPTHDDVTFEAIAKAFDDTIEVNEVIEDALKVYFKTDTLNEGMTKLAAIPRSATLNFPPPSSNSKGLKYPLVSVRNVLIFPGIPELLRKAFEHIGCHILDHSNLRNTTREHFLTETEVQMATRINKLVEKYPNVTFGSYPIWSNNYYKVKLTTESFDPKELDIVKSDVLRSLPVLEGFDHYPSEKSMEKIEKFMEQQDDGLSKKILDSLDVLEECFTRYSPEEVVVAFNGGKDCIVTLHLVHAFLRKKDLVPFSKKLRVLLIEDEQPFGEVIEFVEASREIYNLEILKVPRPMKEGLEQLLSDHSEIKASVLGTRTGDPKASSQKKFSPTDPGWPTLMRVNPILEWSYGDIWAFIRGLFLPYPSLYDRGYTSLGDKRNTLPNPSLAVTDSDGNVVYKPAFSLQDDSLERTGRN